MKKVFTIALFAGISALIACGPSAAEKELQDKLTKDSIVAVEQARMDSIMAEDAANAAKDSLAKTEAAAAEAAAKAAESAKKH
jgi:hypothetical protein